MTELTDDTSPDSVIPYLAVTQVGNEFGVIESTICIEKASVYLNPCTDRENTYFHDFVSNGFIGYGVDHMTKQSVGGFNHAV